MFQPRGGISWLRFQNLVLALLPNFGQKPTKHSKTYFRFFSCSSPSGDRPEFDTTIPERFLCHYIHAKVLYPTGDSPKLKYMALIVHTLMTPLKRDPKTFQGLGMCCMVYERPGKGIYFAQCILAKRFLNSRLFALLRSFDRTLGGLHGHLRFASCLHCKRRL
jgi:hypothetical protein